MSIARTLRKIADWDNRPHVSVLGQDEAMAFYDDLYPDWHMNLSALDNELTRHLLILFAAKVAKDEGL